MVLPPKGFQTFRGPTGPKGPAGPSGGTLGSAMQKASKLKKVREEMKLNKWKFQAGVSDEELKLFGCPGCGEESCYYIGGGPMDIECLNRDCKFFKLPPGTKKPEPPSLEDFEFEWGTD